MDRDDTADTFASPDSRAPTVDSDAARGEAPTVPARAPAERYRLDAVIGRGGMGEIVSARDEQLGRSVAIKRLRKDAPQTISVARFVREARIQGRLEHPAVVPVHELWYDENGKPQFAMKQLAGVTLSEVISDTVAGDPDVLAKFPRVRLLRAFTEICLAIEFAHTRGVVHRDLKPANIQLGDFGEVYVLDWGVARVVADAARDSFADIETLEGGGGQGTLAGALLGTPGYMSPEQARGQADIDARSDVYSLGVILFEILALQPLHERNRGALATTLVGRDARASLRAPDREIPPELDAICVRATAVDRENRYATARELGDAVQRFLDGDRDVALRRQLARDELAAAREALGGGDGDRRLALRAAARALALDPTAREPADLVGRLMLEPPRQIPREVEVAMDARELDALVGTRRLIIASGLSFIAFFPVLYASGYEHVWQLWLGTALGLGMAALGAAATHRTMVLFARVSFGLSAGLIALYARMVTPFLVAPCIAVVGSTILASHSKIARAPVIAAVLIAAVLVPWILEASGAISETTTIVGNTIVLHAATPHLDPGLATGALVSYVTFMVILGTISARSLTNARRDAQRAVEIQAWQLRQLVPER